MDKTAVHDVPELRRLRPSPFRSWLRRNGNDGLWSGIAGIDHVDYVEDARCMMGPKESRGMTDGDGCTGVA